MKKVSHSFINKSLMLFLLILLVSIGVLYMDHEGLISMDKHLVDAIRLIISAAVVIVVTNTLLRLTVNKVFRLFEKEMEIEQRIFLTKIYTIIIYAIAISVLLYISGLQIKDITLFLGLVTTGVAFAIRDIILSFFVWIIVLTKRPFRIGDIITTGEDTGVVERIGSFFMTLKTGEASIKVPNKLLLDRHIRNHGRKDLYTDIRANIGKVKDINKLKQELQKTLKTYKPEISFHVEGKDLILSIRYRSDFYRREQVREEIISLLYKTQYKLFK